MDVSELEFENIGLKSRISKLEANQTRMVLILSWIIEDLNNSYDSQEYDMPWYHDAKELLTYIEE